VKSEQRTANSGNYSLFTLQRKEFGHEEDMLYKPVDNDDALRHFIAGG
jgi:hypothetical protein